jgi:hypothetical protein
MRITGRHTGQPQKPEGGGSQSEHELIAGSDELYETGADQGSGQRAEGHGQEGQAGRRRPGAESPPTFAGVDEGRDEDAEGGRRQDGSADSLGGAGRDHRSRPADRRPLQHRRDAEWVRRGHSASHTLAVVTKYPVVLRRAWANKLSVSPRAGYFILNTL